MSLNIKNERVHALAREAAARTGKSQTSVIEQALEELLERTRDQESGRLRRLEQVDRLLDDMHARIAASGPLMDINDLYDENGLPV